MAKRKQLKRKVAIRKKATTARKSKKRPGLLAKINPVRIGNIYLDVKLPKHPQIILPEGYEFCEGHDDCPRPAERDGDIWCTGATDCNKAGCSCHLFKLKHPRKDNDWHHAQDQGKKEPKDEDNYDYGCLCLKKL